MFWGWMWPGMGLFMLLAMIAICIGMMLLMWRRHGAMMCMGHGMHGDSALDILRQRYAKGELTKEDYGRMRKDLD